MRTSFNAGWRVRAKQNRFLELIRRQPTRNLSLEEERKLSLEDWSYNFA